MSVRAYFKHHQNQTGSTLILGLFILVLIMLLGVTAMKVSDTQFQLAGNLQFEDLAMNNAEAAIDAGERWIAGTTGGAKNYLNAGFTTAATVNYSSAGSNAMTIKLYPISSTPDPFDVFKLKLIRINVTSFNLHLITVLWSVQIKLLVTVLLLDAVKLTPIV